MAEIGPRTGPLTTNENADTMIGEGFELMLVGMGVVFCFLVLLVGVMTLTGWFFQKYASRFPAPEPEAPRPIGVAPQTAGDANAKVAAAVAAAYRVRKGS